MANPQVTQSQTYNTNGSSLSGNKWQIALPALTSASDGYLLVIANSNAAKVQSIYDSTGSLSWAQTVSGSPQYSPVMTNGVTYSLSMWAASLPALLGQQAQTWGGGTEIIQFDSAGDSTVAIAFGVVGDDNPNWLTFDRGTPNGSIFFKGVNTIGSNNLSYSTNTFDTLQLCATISDTGALGGIVPNGFTKIGGTAIWITNYIQMTVGYQNTVGQAITNAQLSWQQSTEMANMLWSMSDAAGVGGQSTNLENLLRAVGRNRLISPVMR